MVPRTDGCREERRDDHGLGVQRRHAVVVVYFAGLDPGAVEGCGGDGTEALPNPLVPL